MNDPSKIFPIAEKPGEREAKDIRRQFEWKTKLDSVHASLEALDRQIEHSIETPWERGRNFDKFDGINIVLDIEKSAKDLTDEVIEDRKKNLRKKVERALGVLTTPVKEEKSEASRAVNEWSSFEKLETERKQFVEAAYRRFRIGPLEPPLEPLPNVFDYETAEYILPNGDKVTQPLASFKTVPTTLGNWTIPDEQAVSRGRISYEKSDVMDRETFLAKLVSKSVKDSPTLHPGQEVIVIYYGVSFPGIILRREFRTGTFVVQFDDGTTSEFPLDAIRIK